MPRELPQSARDRFDRDRSAREWLVTGHVQGVGFRNFVMTKALSLSLTGWARNEADGSVRVYAVGPTPDLDRLAGFLHIGPRMSQVRGVEQREAAVQQLSSFRTE